MHRVYDWRSDKVVASSRRASVHFDDVEDGMSAAQVERLLGEPSERYGNSCWARGDGWVFSASTVYAVCFENDVSSVRCAKKTRSTSRDGPVLQEAA
jgi:hypothetical protein